MDEPISKDGALRMVAYNLGQGGRRDAGAWLRALVTPPPDVLFVQESREPAGSWLAALPGSGPDQCHWEAAASLRWGSGLWVSAGRLTPLPVPGAYRGRVAAAGVEGLSWPVAGRSSVVAISIHAPAAKGSSYIKEVGHILDLAGELAGGLPVVLGGDFNVAVRCAARTTPLVTASPSGQCSGGCATNSGWCPAGRRPTPMSSLPARSAGCAASTPCPTTATACSCLPPGCRRSLAARCWKTAHGVPSATTTRSWRALHRPCLSLDFAR